MEARGLNLVDVQKIVQHLHGQGGSKVPSAVRENFLWGTEFPYPMIQQGLGY